MVLDSSWLVTSRTQIADTNSIIVTWWFCLEHKYLIRRATLLRNRRILYVSSTRSVEKQYTTRFPASEVASIPALCLFLLVSFVHDVQLMIEHAAPPDRFFNQPGFAGGAVAGSNTLSNFSGTYIRSRFHPFSCRYDRAGQCTTSINPFCLPLPQAN